MTNESPTIRELLAEAGERFAAGPHPEHARRDAEMLLLHVLKVKVPDVNLAHLIAHENEAVGTEAASGFRALAGRRAAGEPIQYIVGEAEFYGLEFQVNRDVLIPRPETEHLVEKAIALGQKLRLTGTIPDPRIVDVGTGSGAIAIALAHALPFAEITATDISAAALAVAKANAERNGVARRVRFLEGDLLEPLAGETFDFVVSNPPYVAESDRDRLDGEVRDWEPELALFAGADGLDVYRRLIPAAFPVLVAGGFIVLEIGFAQQAAIEALLKKDGFAGIEWIEDFRGLPRVAVAQRRWIHMGSFERE